MKVYVLNKELNVICFVIVFCTILQQSNLPYTSLVITYQLHFYIKKRILNFERIFDCGQAVVCGGLPYVIILSPSCEFLFSMANQEQAWCEDTDQEKV